MPRIRDQIQDLIFMRIVVEFDPEATISSAGDVTGCSYYLSSNPSYSMDRDYIDTFDELVAIIVSNAPKGPKELELDD